MTANPPLTRRAHQLIAPAFGGAAGGRGVNHSRVSIALIALLFLGTAATAQDLDDFQAMTGLMTRPLAKRALQWECTPAIRFVCTSTGCEKQRGVVSVRLNLAESVYSRCDNKGCDSYPMTFSSEGIFTTVILPGRGGTFFKVVNDGSEYLEIATLHLVSHQYFGTCKPSP